MCIRDRNEGTTLILLGSTETWMKSVAEYTNTVYNGYYNVGKDWIGGIHFVKPESDKAEKKKED